MGIRWACQRAQVARILWVGMLLSVAMKGQTSVLTWHNDNARTGQNLTETTLTPANVNATTFGKLFGIAVDGKVDAQPLYVPSLTIPAMGVHNVLFVATEHDSAYAFDADMGARLWHVSLLAPGETTSDTRGCGQVAPEIGITATPVIDPGIGPHGTMYVIAMSKDTSGNYHQRLHALDLTTGAEQFSGPVEVQATYPGSGSEGSGTVVTFDPKQHKERAALVIVNGVVYTSWSSHCDIVPYTGWVIGYNEATLARVSVVNVTPNGGDGGMWGSGSGPAADASGNLYTLTGNGTFDTTLNAGGFPIDGNYGNAFVKIATAGTPGVVDYFSMSGTVGESNADLDLGSGGLMLLPPLDSLGTNKRLAVGAGKDRNIYVVDRNSMGKFHSPDTIFQELSLALSDGAWSSPAWFNGNLYYGANTDAIKAFAFTNGAFNATPVTQTTTHFTYPGTTPSISANGTSNAIVWALESVNPAVLHAYDATNLATELYNSNQAAAGRDHFGAGNKFIVPTIVNGKVYVGTTNGVGVFGLLCSYALAPQSVSVSASASTASVNVTTSTGCGWTATSNAPWITITSGASGTGSGSVGYSIASDPGPGSRSGTLTIGGQTFTVNQVVAGATKIGTYNAGVWSLDLNGNFTFDNAAVDRQSYWTLGQSGEIPVYGDWNGDGRTKIGVYFNGTWLLDYNGNGIWDGPGIDKLVFHGGPGYVPVVGDWNGSGSTKIGVYQNGIWQLDYNGNFVWDGPGIDKLVFFGGPGYMPVVGDWNGSGTTKIGVYQNGTWLLDYNGNFAWDGSGVDKVVFHGGPGFTPVVGDWNGSGTTKLGAYQNGLWLLDFNGNFVWDGSGIDRVVFFGGTGYTPLVGDWNGGGTTKIGAYLNGQWVIDVNGNFVWDPPTDRVAFFGGPGQIPIVGKW
jgi:hypothetical protein